MGDGGAAEAALARAARLPVRRPGFREIFAVASAPLKRAAKCCSLIYAQA